ncbi:MAG: LysR family transcriptional regulator [Emcibacteraceae bacterium]|jgi:DNA-binding transcriptional LysR family regulator|uniref:LysR family transcriptional regulator n=1 Tax=Pseudemcibacter sp. TaxID=2943293 RepID=UPI003F69B14C|nr:LysR family transcriptional regulator [Emcibacteraceae bacterium]MDG1727108.1 LysR family transcriptional regulator [Emcibacteraceae bacterium]
MDIPQIRTFIAVADTGSFIAAAEKVFVTQSTVSIRIKNLEEQLGTTLFERNKQGARLTVAGKHFLKHAIALARIWDEARLSVGLGEQMEALLVIGGQVSLWDDFLMRLLPWMRIHMPEVAIKTELGYSPDLMQKLTEGSLDIAIMYRPENRPGFKIKQIFEEELVLVSSLPDNTEVFDHDYVFVDWGPEFISDHALNFPEITTPRVSLDMGSLGIKYLLLTPSSGYFPKRIAQPLIDNGDIRIVDWAPSFKYPAYLAYSDNIDIELIKNIQQGINVIKKEFSKPSK